MYSSLRNTRRVADVWLADYAAFFLDIQPEVANIDAGDISSRSAIRQKLKCKSFDWYHKNVYPELNLPIDRPGEFYVKIRNNDYCLGYDRYARNWTLKFINCSDRYARQLWKANNQNSTLMIPENFCLTTTESDPEKITVATCNGGSSDRWEIDDQRIKLKKNGFCLSGAMSSLPLSLSLKVGVPLAIVVGGHYCYKTFNFNVPVYDVPKDLKKRVFIVTGANEGIGKATVEALAPTGARVIMACRSADQCRDVRRQIVISSKNRQVVCRECDLSSFESIKKFAARMIKEEPRIDVLINNAGVKYVYPRETTRESIEVQLATNFLGHHLLTALLVDKLKECAPSRIVNVIGNAYTKGTINFEDLNMEKNYQPADAYDQSKLATALTTIEWARRLEGSGVTINGVDPGPSFTNIERHTDAWFKFIRSAFYYISRREARQGAFPPLYAALSLEMKGITGKYVNKLLDAQDFSDSVGADEILQKKMFLTGDKWARLEQAKEDVKSMVASMPEPTTLKKEDQVSKIVVDVTKASQNLKPENLKLNA
uniref:Ricin B lectin domain-containing protein n=1 Tax=Romanomermis culicivorax TaxID=13658 RepID=A0A915JNJ6_ROMCU